MATQKQIEDLKEMIALELSVCDSSETPTVCSNIQTPEGLNKTVGVILKLVLDMKTTVSMAILKYEELYNVNALD